MLFRHFEVTMIKASNEGIHWSDQLLIMYAEDKILYGQSEYELPNIASRFDPKDFQVRLKLRL